MDLPKANLSATLVWCADMERFVLVPGKRCVKDLGINSSFAGVICPVMDWGLVSRVLSHAQ